MNDQNKDAKKQYDQEHQLEKKEYYQEKKAERKEYQEVYYQEHKAERKEYQTTYNKKNRVLINSKQRQYNLRIEQQEFAKRYMKFKKATKDGPTYVCNCCKRSLFKSGMFSVYS